MPYSTIVVDPPWSVAAGRTIGRYEKKGGKQLFGVRDNGARQLSYPSMSLHQITALPVAELAPADAHLYLWTINKYLPDAFGIAQAWGFTFSTMLVWAKNPMGGGLGGA